MISKYYLIVWVVVLRFVNVVIEKVVFCWIEWCFDIVVELGEDIGDFGSVCIVVCLVF